MHSLMRSMNSCMLHNIKQNVADQKLKEIEDNKMQLRSPTDNGVECK